MKAILRDFEWRDWVIVLLCVAFSGQGIFAHFSLKTLHAQVDDLKYLQPIDREEVARGTTVIIAQAGSKILAYPMGDFVIEDQTGGVTVFQMPKVEAKKGKKGGKE